MIRTWWLYAILTAGTVGWATPGRAAVADSSNAGFTVKLEATVAAAPDKAYRQVTNAIGKWWGPTHTFSGDANNMYIEDHAGGCFCERMDRGGSVQHMRVVLADPGKSLNLTGGLGPLQTLAAVGNMAWNFEAKESGTVIHLTYAVGGYFPGGTGGLPGAVDHVLGEQLARLKRFLETGRPTDVSKR